MFKRPIGLYLDLFSDATSLDNFIVAQEMNVDSPESVAFGEVFKNNLEDIDDSNVVNGNLYGHLQ